MADPPRVLAQLDERPRIVVRPDGSLLGLTVVYHEGSARLQGRASYDGGSTWGEPESLLPLPDEAGAWAGCQPLVAADGEMHALLVNDAGTDVLRVPGRARKPKPLLERHLDVWHTRTDGRGSLWREPVKIWEGYTGSINSIAQTRSGRILLPFAYLTDRSWSNRGDGLDQFWFAGQNTTTVLYCDDGETWQLSGAELKAQTPSIGVYGAVEPVIVELSHGKLWMLARTQLGRFYESLSDDGVSWSPLQPSPLINSDSPAGLARLSDGRLVLLWNKCLRFPYAHGGRHVLHAAVSEDDGRSWIGHREVARDPRRYLPPPPAGDHGTAYPFPVALPDDTVLVTTGQGGGCVVVVAIDPEWLYETTQEAVFQHLGETASAAADAASVAPAAGPIPDDWSAFGCRGVGIGVDAEQGPVLEVGRTHLEWPTAAVWNHPLGQRGQLTLRMRLDPATAGARLLLTDHFSVPFDPEDALQSMFALRVVTSLEAMFPESANPLVPGEGTLTVEAGRWHDLQVVWDLERWAATARLHGGPPVRFPLRRLADGVCYLRLRPVATGLDPGFAIAAASVSVG